MLINWERYLSNCQSFTVKKFRTQRNSLIEFLLDIIMLLNLDFHHGIPKGHGNWEMPKFLD